MGELALAGGIVHRCAPRRQQHAAACALVRPIGDRAYLGVYSLMAAVTLVYLIIAYNRASHADFLWIPTPALRVVRVRADADRLRISVGRLS